MSEWQPIETAPKDGTPILLFGDFEGELGWIEKSQIGIGSCEHGGCSLDNTDYYSVAIRATHWMPLPSPPEVKP